MSETTIGRIRCGLWITAGSLFFGSLLIDLMDGHSDPLVQTLLAYAQMSALAAFITGCLLVLVGRIDRIVRAPEQLTEAPTIALAVPQRGPDTRYLTDMAESVRLGREIERRRAEPPEVGV